jgi:hypothetical protein
MINIRRDQFLLDIHFLAVEFTVHHPHVINCRENLWMLSSGVSKTIITRWLTVVKAVKWFPGSVAPIAASLGYLSILSGSNRFNSDQSRIFAVLIPDSQSTESWGCVLEPNASNTMSLMDLSAGLDGVLEARYERLCIAAESFRFQCRLIYVAVTPPLICTGRGSREFRVLVIASKKRAAVWSCLIQGILVYIKRKEYTV